MEHDAHLSLVEDYVEARRMAHDHQVMADRQPYTEGQGGRFFADPGIGKSTDPGTNNNILVSIRTAIGDLQDSGYDATVIVLPPATAAAIDVMVSGVSGGTADFVNGPAQVAPDRLFGVPRRVSKAATAPLVLDASAFGRSTHRR